MSDALAHATDTGQPPATFRDGLADTERLAGLLVQQVSGQLVIPTSEVEFLARRIHGLARAAHRALPAEVT